MNELCLKIWLQSKSVNWYRVVFVIIAVYFAVAGNEGDWLNSILVAGVFSALYKLGYYSSLTDQVNGNIK